jgi:methyl acetate hydrolase
MLAGKLSALQGHPMAFDPGDGFVYGPGYDWLAPIVKQIDGRSIDRFCQEEIFEPLGMRDTMFELDGAADRLADVKLRGDDGHFVDFDAPTAFGAESVPPSRPEYYGMGQALYGTGGDYLRFLRMVLDGGELDGRRVLGPDALKLMTENQMGDMSVPTRMRTNALPILVDVEWFPGTRMTHTAAFFRNESDIPGMRSAGSLCWAGFMNTHHWVDPVKDVAAVLMTQSLPFWDAGCMEAFDEFERAVYRLVSGSGDPGSKAGAAAASRA